MKKHDNEFEKFDRAMDGLLAVPYSEIQQKLAEEKKAKAKKKKRPTSTASRVSSGHKKRVA